MLDTQDRKSLTSLYESTFLSADKAIPAEEDDLSPEAPEVSPAPEASPEEIEPAPEVASVALAIEAPAECCDECKELKQNIHTIMEAASNLSNMANSGTFEKVFEPWMLSKISVCADGLTSVLNAAKFNEIDQSGI